MDNDGAPTWPRRTRTGCQCCRRRKRKCDERRPSCGACCKSGLRCEWGLKLSFLPENAKHLDSDHPSMRMAARKPPHGYDVRDMTSKVTRDYNVLPPPGLDLQDERGITGLAPLQARMSTAGQSTVNPVLHNMNHQNTINESLPTSSGRLRVPAEVANSPLVTTADALPMARRQTENAVASLLHLSQSGQAKEKSHSTFGLSERMPVEHTSQFQGSIGDGSYSGSAYFERHSTSRSWPIHPPKSTASVLSATHGPDIDAFAEEDAHENVSDSYNSDSDDAADESEAPEVYDAVTHDELLRRSVPPVLLSKRTKCILWRHWFDETAPWLDMLDNERHFQLILPAMAAEHDCLRFSMLALSARHMRHTCTNDSIAGVECFPLYAEASHILRADPPPDGIAVVASRLILCAYEMLNDDGLPDEWKWNLDSCSNLVNAAGLTGFVGGMKQALFWCFHRMDICFGLPSLVLRLNPVPHKKMTPWTNLAEDDRLFRLNKTPTSWANYALYLIVQVVDLLTPLSCDWRLDFNRADPNIIVRWIRLWKCISDWPAGRPGPLRPIMTIASSDSSPFPTMIFSNPAAILANQLYHTASLLMLKNEPHGLELSLKPPSVLWHARQVCAISMSNEHHGSWAHGAQPLWIAGRYIRHPAERKAILGLFARMAKETALSVGWAVEDLEAFWAKR